MPLVHDLRLGLRRLRNTPLFTVSVVGTLTIAIAAVVVVFSAVNAIVLRPLPIRQPDRVIVMSETSSIRGQTLKEVSYRNFVDWRAESRSFEAMVAISSTNSDFVLDRAGQLMRFEGALVSASFFDLLGTPPQLGRVLVPDDDRRGAARVLVLSDRFWRQQFGADADVVGTAVVVSDQPFTVVGVMPRDFGFPRGADAWTPVVPALAFASAEFKVDALEARYFGLLSVVGRLAPGVSAEEARAELDVIARRLPESEVEEHGLAITATPLLDSIFGATRRGLMLLFAMVCIVLLIACANVASLVLARAASLGRGFAVKFALGASRWHIVRECAAEMAIVISAAGAIGICLAWLSLRPLLALAPSSLPRVETARIDLPVLAFALLVSVIITVLCAIAPALQASRRAPRLATLARGTQLWRVAAGDGPPPLVARSILTVIQVAFATVLLTGAGLLVRSFDQLRQIDPGFQPQRVLTLDVEPQAQSTAQYRLAYDAILERVAALPSVEAVGAVYLRPLVHGSFGLDSGYLLEGQRIDRPESWQDNATLNAQAVTPGYFDAMRIALGRGRLFSARDTAEAPAVAIVSTSTARRLWPGKDPIGQRLSVASGRTETGEFPMSTVVGVVADVRYRGINDTRLDIYLPATQTLNRVKHLMVRTTGDPAAVVRSVQTAIGEMTTRTVVEYVDTMERVITDAVAPWRFSMTLLVGLAALGVFLATVGLFALVAYSVDQRAPDLAVRLALGARPAMVLRMVLWQGGRFAIMGLAVGVLLALAVANQMSSLLFQVPARDTLTFIAAAGLLGATAFVASYLAARRVIRIDPMLAMRAL
jgi:putative ABC transport system permease protein